MTAHDDVNNPAHYDLFPGQQAIDIIKAALTPDEFAGYLKGNALKYRLRAGQKGDAEKCLAKANWYRDRLWAECAATGSFDESAIGDAGGEWPESRADIIGQNGNEGEHYEAAASDPYMPTDEEWLAHPWAQWSVIDIDCLLIMCSKEPELIRAGNSSSWSVAHGAYCYIEVSKACDDWRTTKRQRPAHLTAKPQDDIPTIKRSALPAWVPADAVWFVRACEEFPCDTAYALTHDGIPHFCTLVDEWTIASRWDCADDMLAERKDLMRIIEG